MDTHTQMAPAMALALEASFGSVARWREEFTALASKAGRALLVFQPRAGTLANRSSHQDGVPILELDLRQQSLQDIDWEASYQRYQEAVQDASEPFGATQDELANALVLDVRRAGVFEQADSRLPGAAWRDPAAVGHWAGDLPAGREVVVYCVYGHEVGRATALRLRAAGLQARYLRGGIDGWIAAGRGVDAKGEAS